MNEENRNNKLGFEVVRYVHNFACIRTVKYVEGGAVVYTLWIRLILACKFKYKRYVSLN